MDINDLKRIMPAREPINKIDDIQWSIVEKELKIILPTDYKTFIANYGTGSIDNFLWVLNPFTENENLNLFKKSELAYDAYLESKKQFPAEFVHEVFPRKGGLFLWAISDNGDEIYWLTEGDSDSWPIIIYPSRSSEYVKYEMTVIDTIYKLLCKDLVCSIFPDDFPSDQPEFLSLN